MKKKVEMKKLLFRKSDSNLELRIENRKWLAIDSFRNDEIEVGYLLLAKGEVPIAEN